MTLTIDLNPQEETRLLAAARQEGIEPEAFAKKLLTESLPMANINADDEIGSFGGRSVGDIMREIGFVEGGPPDLSSNPAHMKGFGITKKARDLTK